MLYVASAKADWQCTAQMKFGGGGVWEKARLADLALPVGPGCKLEPSSEFLLVFLSNTRLVNSLTS